MYVCVCITVIYIYIYIYIYIEREREIRTRGRPRQGHAAEGVPDPHPELDGGEAVEARVHERSIVLDLLLSLT